jgi:hypothetical protein
MVMKDNLEFLILLLQIYRIRSLFWITEKPANKVNEYNLLLIR